MDHLMLDSETFGVKPGCVVLSIGAVLFDPESVKLGTSFEVNIDLNSAVDAGLKIEPNTLIWWMEQSQEARAETLHRPTMLLKDALQFLSDTFDWKELNVWCNGAAFDFPILEAAYAAVNLSPPWTYWKQYDYRTLKNLVPRDVYNGFVERPKVAHAALNDATSQALTACRLLNYLGETRG